MRWLIQTNVTTAGQWKRGRTPPGRGLNFSELNAFGFQRGHVEVEIIAHQVEHCSEHLSGMQLRELTLERMKRGFRRWHCEDKPASADINGAEPEYITKECAIGFGVFAV